MPAVLYCPRRSAPTHDIARAAAVAAVTDRRVTLPPPIAVMRAKIMANPVRKWGGKDHG